MRMVTPGTMMYISFLETIAIKMQECDPGWTVPRAENVKWLEVWQAVVRSLRMRVKLPQLEGSLFFHTGVTRSWWELLRCQAEPIQTLVRHMFPTFRHACVPHNVCHIVPSCAPKSEILSRPGRTAVPASTTWVRRSSTQYSWLTPPTWVYLILVGGLEHFLFSHILGIILPID